MSKTIALNRAAYYKYSIKSELEAGICLKGCEVKSIRNGRVDIKHSFARIIDGEVFMLNAHIAPYEKSDSRENYDPLRSRKLLLKKREIRKLQKKLQVKGVTLVPVKIYFKRGKAKVSIAVARGKTRADKREAIKERISKREIDRARKQSSRNS